MLKIIRKQCRRASSDYRADGLFLILLVSAFVSGCIDGRTGVPQFSANSTTVAYLWQTEVLAPIGPERVRIRQRVDLRWCAVGHPERLRSVTIDTAGRELWNATLENYVQFSFSPDSSQIAVSTRGDLSCIDLDTGERRRLNDEGEIVSSFAWVAEDEIGYMANSNVSGARGTQIADRIVWRQHVHRPREQRRAIFQQVRVDVDLLDVGYSPGMFPPSESWSPRGNYLIFLSSPMRGELQLLNVATGQVSSFGAHDLFLIEIAWKPDDSAVVCLVNSMSQTGWPPKEALLLHEPATARTVDVTRDYESLGLDESAFGIERRWTEDGTYIVINDVFGVGGVLIRPRPWEVIQVGEHLRRLLGPLPQWQSSMTVEPLGIPGWVQTGAHGVEYAYNYRNDELVELGDSTNTFIVVSPDGSKVARLTFRGKLTVSAVDLEPAPPKNNGE